MRHLRATTTLQRLFLISTGALGLLAVTGIIFYASQSPTKHNLTSHLTSSTHATQVHPITSSQQPKPTTTATMTATQSQPASAAIASTTQTHTTTNPSQQTTTQPAPTTSKAAAIVAISASVSSPTSPEPYSATDQVSYQYCAYTYSDNSTQQTLVSKQVNMTTYPISTCTLANAPPAHSAPATSTGANVTDWTNPVPETNSTYQVCTAGPTGKTCYPTYIQYRYCIWTYSDDSTQAKVYQTDISANVGSTSSQSISESGYNCTKITAPTAVTVAP